MTGLDLIPAGFGLLALIAFLYALHRMRAERGDIGLVCDRGTWVRHVLTTMGREAEDLWRPESA